MKDMMDKSRRWRRLRGPASGFGPRLTSVWPRALEYCASAGQSADFPYRFQMPARFCRSNWRPSRGCSASLLKGLKRVMFIKFATGGERSDGEHILADGAIALAWPCTGQLCAGIVERPEPVARAVATDVGPPIDLRRGGPRLPDRRDYVEKPVRRMSGINVADDVIPLAIARGGRKDDRAAFAFAFDAFRQALQGATDRTFRRPAEEEVKAAARSPVDARWRNTVVRLEGLPCCNAVVSMWRGGIDIDREHASPAAHGHGDQRVQCWPKSRSTTARSVVAL